MPNARRAGQYTAGTARQRAADLKLAYQDPSVAAIVCSAGGNLSVQILHLLDFELIGKNPKVFCGYSDATALHAAIGKFAQTVTFYGPSLMADWAELPSPARDTVMSFRRATGVSQSYGRLEDPTWEVSEHVDWNLDRVRARNTAMGRRVLRRGRAQGELVGGCLPVLCQLLGTTWFPNVEGKILFLDLPPIPYGPKDALVDLWHLRNSDVLEMAAGILISRPHLGRDRDAFDAVIDSVVGRYAPVLSGIASGHTQPNLTLPLGIGVAVEDDQVEILEPAVQHSTVARQL